MNPKTQRIHLVFALIFSTMAASGCAAAAPSEKGAATPAAEEAEGATSSVEGAIAEIDRAEGELQRALGVPAFAEAPKAGAQPPGQMDQAPAAPAKPPAPAPPTATATAAADSSPVTRLAQEPSGDPCQTACRALSGMNRATGHLCELSGEADSRCEHARERVRAAGDRVRSYCPSCAGD